MEFEVLYQFELGSFQWDIFIIPLIFIFLGFYALRIIKRYGFRHSLQSWGFFPNMDFTMLGKFFAFLFIFFGVIGLIGILVTVTIELTEQKMFKDIIENQDYMIVEGRVVNFSPIDSLNNLHESFTISEVKFTYSENDDFYGYSKIFKNGGVIKSNGQYLRINYYSVEGQNIICKIEGIKNH